MAHSRGVSVTDIDLTKFKIRVLEESPGKNKPSPIIVNNTSNNKNTNQQKNNKGGSKTQEQDTHNTRGTSSFSRKMVAAMQEKEAEAVFSDRRHGRKKNNRTVNGQVNYLNRPNNNNNSLTNTTLAAASSIDPVGHTTETPRRESSRSHRKRPNSDDEDYVPYVSKKVKKSTALMQQGAPSPVGTMYFNNKRPMHIVDVRRPDWFYRQKFGIAKTLKVILEMWYNIEYALQEFLWDIRRVSQKSRS